MVGRYKPVGQRNGYFRSQAVMWHEAHDVSDVDPFEDAIKEHRKDAGRSREEIDRLTVDEDLGDLERACLFLSPNAHSLQQSCALGKLHSLFKEYGVTAYEALFPTFTTSLEAFSPHSQVVAAEAFTAILRDESMSKEAPNWFLPMAMHMVKSPRSNEVMHAWLGTLRALVPLVPQQVLTEDLLQLALAKGQGEESVQAHTVCCNIFGAMAPLLEGKFIVQTFLHKAMALCQDTDAEVRMCMCEQLDAISRSVGYETFMVFVFPELNELLTDEEAVVQNAAIESLVQLLNFLPPDIREAQVLPFLRSLCDEGNAAVLVCVARLFGDIVIKEWCQFITAMHGGVIRYFVIGSNKMVPDLSDDDLQILVDAYKGLAQQPSEDIRQLCTFNFPAVLKTIGSRKYSTMLHTTYIQFVQDPSPAVRCTTAASFHEVAKILGRERTATYLKDPFLLLLKDPTSSVQSKLFGILQQVLGHFSVSNVHSKTAIYTAIIPSLLHAEKYVSCTNQWRLQRSLLQAFPQFPEYLTSDQIHENFVPICFRYMADGVLPVKCSAALALAVFIRNNCKTMQRYEMSQKVVKEYGQGKSFWTRLLYIDFCESLLRVASSRMFKENFLESAISALQDPVPSIRMRACQIVNHLRTVIRLPDDVGALERINHLATQRLNDTDREVVAAARIASDDQKRVFIHDRDPAHEHPAQDEYEKMDKLREDEEWNMLSKEEQEEKRKLDENLQRLKIENLRKTSVEISRNATTSTSESSSSYHPAKKGSTNRGSTNGGRLSIDQGRTSRGSLLKAKAPGSQNPTTGSTNNGTSSGSPASIPQGSVQTPLLSSGSSQPQPPSSKRGSGHKPSPPSPGPPVKAQSVPSASPANSLSDSTSAPANLHVPRRNSYKAVKKNSTGS